MIHFFVPIAPVAKARARHRQVKTKNGSFVQTYTPSRTRDYEKKIANFARDQMLMIEPTSKPVRLDLTFFLPIPDSWPAWKKKAAQDGHIAHTSKPDRDNLEKAIKDALNGIVWNDDAQVCIGESRKIYSDEPGVMISAIVLPVAPAQITKRSDLLMLSE